MSTLLEIGYLLGLFGSYCFCFVAIYRHGGRPTGGLCFFAAWLATGLFWVAWWKLLIAYALAIVSLMGFHLQVYGRSMREFDEAVEEVVSTLKGEDPKSHDS